MSTWKEVLGDYLFLKNRSFVENDLSWIDHLIVENKRKDFISHYSRLHEQQKERSALPLKSTIDIKHFEIQENTAQQVELSLLLSEGTLYKIGNQLYKQEVEERKAIALSKINDKWVVVKEENEGEGGKRREKGHFPFSVPSKGSMPENRNYFYNRMEAVRYAELWWNNYNPMYRHFTDDCTNFISQCLFAGGIPMEISRNRSKGWWYTGGYEEWSYSWTIANSLKLYLQHGVHIRTERRENPEQLSIGDIICYDFDGDGHWQHNTIVVAKDINGMPLINAHTTNSRHRYWDYRDSTAYTPKIQYRFFHIH